MRPGLRISAPWVSFSFASCFVVAAWGSLALHAMACAREEPGRVKNESRPEAERNLGRELFVREWIPDDRRSHGGDGLGPVYNERSCAGCHYLGGIGGGGPADKNIEIITPMLDGESPLRFPAYFYAFSFSYGADGFQYRIGNPSPNANRMPRGAALNRAELVQLHPGFRDAQSVVLHRYGSDGDYRVWREWVLGRHGTITMRSSLRNPIALFGTGLIDQVPEAVIEAVARRKHAGSPQVKGRPSRLADGRIGRFGWKAQTASLREFVIKAAATELGLDVPGHAQAADPRIPPLKASGNDMNAAECDAQIAYVRSLPAPAVRKPANPRDERALKAGKALFRSIGCAECHVPRLGGIENLYSDLLLHAMGPDLADTASYGAFLAGAEARLANAPRAQPIRRGESATDEEWRTPPLWGLRDSAPYLHDGRAASIEEAIVLHGGEASAAAERYKKLPPRDLAQLQFFLLSLAAP